MAAELVVVAGATSRLGRAVAAQLKARGLRVRGLSRGAAALAGDPSFDEALAADALQPETLAGAFDGATRVFSSVGASVQPGLAQRRSYLRFDTPANRNLIAAAEEAGAKHFAYVSVAGHADGAHLSYIRAHEAVVEALRASPLSAAVVRPTGFFGALEEAFLPMAGKRGWAPVLGDPDVRSNPIHEEDLAEICADAVCDDGFGEQTVGGPEVLTRREMAVLALEAVGRPATKVRRFPAWMARMGAIFAWPLNPRTAAILKFYAWVGTHDAVFDQRGTRRLGDYFATRARERFGVA